MLSSISGIWAFFYLFQIFNYEINELFFLKAKLLEVAEIERKGSYTSLDDQKRLPNKLVNRLLKKYKQPVSIDTGY